MTREPSFPFDWLSPGERRYCSHGTVLLDPASPFCHCHPPSDLTPMESIEWRRISRKEQARHEEIERSTLALAEQRRNAGMNPLFWMEETQ